MKGKHRTKGNTLIKSMFRDTDKEEEKIHKEHKTKTK
jgi:hypothetical protein